MSNNPPLFAAPEPLPIPKSRVTGAVWWQAPGALLAALLLLCSGAFLNRQPIFYADTPTYVRGAEMGAAKLAGANTFKRWLPAKPESLPQSSALEAGNNIAATDSPTVRLKPLTSIDDKVVLAGRSVYYGALLYAGYLTGGMWLTVMVQALAVAYMLHLLLVQLWGFREREFVGAIAVMCILTPLASYTGFLMPDVFAPLVILGAIMLAVYWRQLRPADRWLLAGVVLFGLCAHTSHIALAGILLVLLGGVRWLGRRRWLVHTAGLIVVGACLVGALAAEWVFNQAVTRTVGAPPMRLPHPMARLIDLGPGTTYLKANCPAANFAACDFVQNYPTKWSDFLFSTDPRAGAFALADVNTKRRLADEQGRFVWAVFQHDPIGVLSGVGRSIVHQIFNFRVDIWNYGEGAVAKFFGGRVPDDLYADMLRSRAASYSPIDQWQTVSTYITAASGAALMAWLGWGRRKTLQAKRSDRTGVSARLMTFAWLSVGGVLANAFVCATFASSMDRFQARVIWVLPLVAWAAFIGLRRQRVQSEKELLNLPGSQPHPTAPTLLPGTTLGSAH